MKILTNALCSIAELTYWTQYINPIVCLIFLGSSLVINMLLVNLILVHMLPHFLHKIDRHMTRARERKKWPIAVLNIKCFESKHRDNFSVVLHTKYLFDKTLWRVSKRCVWPSHPLLSIHSLSLLNFYGFRCHESLAKTVYPDIHMITSATFFFRHCIKLPKNEYWHIKGWTNEPHEWPMRIFKQHSHLMWYAICMEATDKCQKRYCVSCKQIDSFFVHFGIKQNEPIGRYVSIYVPNGDINTKELILTGE